MMNKFSHYLLSAMLNPGNRVHFFRHESPLFVMPSSIYAILEHTDFLRKLQSGAHRTSPAELNLLIQLTRNLLKKLDIYGAYSL